MSGRPGDNAVIFQRVSTGKQDETPQLPVCLGYCEERRYNLYRDPIVAHGKSAFKGEQEPYWQEAIEEIKSGRAQVVVLWMPDRLDRRDIRKAIPMAEAVLGIGGHIEFADEEYRYDLDDHDGFKQFVDDMHAAWRESMKRSKRTRIHHDARYAANALVGRPPFGYEIITGSNGYKYLRQDEETGPIVVQMVSWYLDEELSRRAIADRLDAMKIPTPDHRGHRNAEGWTPKTVSYILRNESLIGIRRSRAGKIVMKFEEIRLIEPGTFARLQRAIDANAKRRGNTVKPKGMLDSIAYCGNCGHRLYYRKDPARFGNYIWYGLRCMGTTKNPSKCKVVANVADVEPYVDSLFVGNGIFAPRHIFETRTYNPAADYKSQIDNLEYRVQHELDAVHDPDYIAKRAEILAEIERLGEKLAEAKIQSERHDTGIAVRDYWPTLNAQQKRAFLLKTTFRVHVSMVYRYGDSEVEADRENPDLAMVAQHGKPKRHVRVVPSGDPVELITELEHLRDGSGDGGRLSGDVALSALVLGAANPEGSQAGPSFDETRAWIERQVPPDAPETAVEPGPLV
jgi:DNA invertase Pin-like site-specific DNA recombinase